MEYMQHRDFGMRRVPKDVWLAGKTSLPALLPQHLCCQETQSSCCLCADLLSNPQHHPPAKQRPPASQYQHSQPPTQPAKTLAALSEAVAAGIGSEDGVVDRAGTQRAPEQVILFFWGQEGAIAVWHCLGLPGGCS